MVENNGWDNVRKYLFISFIIKLTFKLYSQSKIPNIVYIFSRFACLKYAYHVLLIQEIQVKNLTRDQKIWLKVAKKKKHHTIPFYYFISLGSLTLQTQGSWHVK